MQHVIRANVPSRPPSLHLHRDRLHRSRVSRLRLLMERTGIWETDRKTVRAQPSLTNADSKASQMSQVVEQISTEILERLLALENPSKEDVNKVKIDVCRKYKSPFVPANSSILQLLSDDLRPRLRPVLTDKQVRGMSGVTTLDVMPKP